MTHPSPFCQYLQTQAAIREWYESLIPNHPVTLKFYNNKRRNVATWNSHELIYYGDMSSPYFRTEREYLIAIHNALHRATQDGQVCTFSYVEVIDTVFVRRHYVRSGHLSPLWSTEVDATKDELLRDRQIATKPVLDWRRVMSDSFFGRVDRNVSIKQFVDKYKL